MTAPKREEHLALSRAGDFATGQQLARVQIAGLHHEQLQQECDDDMQCRLNILQHWICELLRKNQQLRVSLEAAISQQTREMDQ